MKYFILVLLIANSAVLACERSTEIEEKKILSETLQPFFNVYINDQVRIVEYCPETPCEKILVSSDIDETVVIDFSVLFYLFTTSYQEFQDERYKMPSGLNPYSKLRELVSNIVNKYYQDATCLSDVLPEECVMDYLVKKYNIKTKLITESM